MRYVVTIVATLMANFLWAKSTIEIEGEAAMQIYLQLDVPAMTIELSPAIIALEKRTAEANCQERIWIYEGQRKTYWCEIPLADTSF